LFRCGKNMSRIGQKLIKLPDSVKLTNLGNKFTVTGPKSQLTLVIPVGVTVEIIKNEVFVKTTESKTNLQGVVRATLANMVFGVSEGWSKILELSGTGFKVTTTGSELNLALGFSHPVKVIAPAGISFEVKENKIKVLGADKAAVGEVAAKIRKLKPADVYKHKGLKYENEKLIKKAGKAAKAGAPGAK